MTVRKLVTMREALESDAYFGKLLAADSWACWRVLLIAIMGEPLLAGELIIFKGLTGREFSPSEALEEFWGIIGRRGGKTRAMAVLASYIAACIDHRAVLAPGERGVLPVMAASTLQAAQAFNFIAGAFEVVPRFKGLVTGRTADTLSLSTGVDIQVRPASFRTIRGITAVGAIADEAAWWKSDDSANPDTEILNALRPSLATTGGILAVISSPHAKRGELYATFRKHYGPKGHPRILVAKGASLTLNPGLSQRVVDRAYEEDPAAAAAEYGAEFRTDVETFIAREVVEAAIEPGRFELPRMSGVSYKAFVDPSGGAHDSMTIAIAHAEGEICVLDAMREVRPPFSPEEVTREFSFLLKSYGIGSVRGDLYAGLWPRERMRVHGIEYELTDRSKSNIYRDFLPLANSKRVALLDSPRLVAQLCNLERRTARGGRDSIDHAPGAHDDLCNSVCGVLVSVATVSDDFDIEEYIRAYS